VVLVPVRLCVCVCVCIHSLCVSQVKRSTTGSFSVATSSRSGSESLLNIISTGEVIGEMSFLSGSPTCASVIADTDCEIVCVDTENLLALFERDQALGGGLRFACAIVSCLLRMRCLVFLILLLRATSSQSPFTAYTP
jgi:CRP-like cAMP-binding protein